MLAVTMVIIKVILVQGLAVVKKTNQI